MAVILILILDILRQPAGKENKRKLLRSEVDLTKIIISQNKLMAGIMKRLINTTTHLSHVDKMSDFYPHDMMHNAFIDPTVIAAAFESSVNEEEDNKQQQQRTESNESQDCQPQSTEEKCDKPETTTTPTKMKRRLDSLYCDGGAPCIASSSSSGPSNLLKVVQDEAEAKINSSMNSVAKIITDNIPTEHFMSIVKSGAEHGVSHFKLVKYESSSHANDETTAINGLLEKKQFHKVLSKWFNSKYGGKWDVKFDMIDGSAHLYVDWNFVAVDPFETRSDVVLHHAFDTLIETKYGYNVMVSGDFVSKVKDLNKSKA